jgi:hypothetical protein
VQVSLLQLLVLLLPTLQPFEPLRLHVLLLALKAA